MIGIAFYKLKYDANFGLIMRAAYNFNVDIIFNIGDKKYTGVITDTFKTYKQIPIANYKTLDDFMENYPHNFRLISLETHNDQPIETFIYPKNPIFLFGGENITLPKELPNCDSIKINTKGCLNVAMAATICLYDFNLKRNNQ